MATNFFLFFFVFEFLLLVNGNVVKSTEPSIYDLDYTTEESELEDEIEVEAKSTSTASTLSPAIPAELRTINSNQNLSVATSVSAKVVEILNKGKVLEVLRSFYKPKIFLIICNKYNIVRSAKNAKI